LLAYQVARAQLVEARLRPALAAGEWVILDRFWYSTVAYQAHGLGLDEGQVRTAIALAVGDLRADVALLLRVDPAQAAARRADQQDDRIEARGLAYLERVAAGYDAQVARGDLVALDGGQAVDEVAAAVWAAVAPVLD
jgi:dTMP kinase